MTLTLPKYQSQVANLVTASNFIAYQSAQIAATGTSGFVTFTALPTGRVTAVVANSGIVGAYLASGAGSATAVASTTSVQPTTGTAISQCFYVAPGAIYTLDFVAGTNTFAAITSTGTTTLEISVGTGS